MEEAQQYYAWAALYGNRMPKKYRGLSQTLARIAVHFSIYHEVLNHMGSRYFNLWRQLSPGELFHLERQAHEDALPYIEEEALDQMLDAYNRWRAKPTKEARMGFLEACASYGELNSEFNPAILESSAEPASA